MDFLFVLTIIGLSILYIIQFIVTIFYLVRHMIYIQTGETNTGTKFNIGIFDYIIYGISAISFGIAMQSLWGVAVGVGVFLCIKLLHFYVFMPKQDTNLLKLLVFLGSWMTIQWIKVPPKGVAASSMPMLTELHKIPKKVTIYLPRAVLVILISIGVWLLKKIARNTNTGMPFSGAQLQDILQSIQQLIFEIQRLQKNQTYPWTLPVGVISFNHFL
jgi:hypothetical protein